MVEHERCLCIIAKRKIYGFNVSKLIQTATEEEEEDDEEMHALRSLRPPPFDLVEDLPVRYAEPVHHDSKIYLVGGQKPFKFPSYTIYELEFDITDDDDEDEKKNKTQVKASETIYRISRGRTIKDDLIVCISGDLYFQDFETFAPTNREGEVSFEVLRGFIKSEALESPPIPCPFFFASALGSTCAFVFEDKYFVRTFVTRRMDAESHFRLPEEYDVNKRLFFYSFDPSTRKWTEHDENFMKSFILPIGGEDRFCPPSFIVSPLPGLGDSSNFSLSLTSLVVEVDDGPGEEDWHRTAVMHAFLFDKSKNIVRLHQPITGCFEGIGPVLRSLHTSLVDLGDGKLCALLYGRTKKSRGCVPIPVLCMSVFTLSLKEDELVHLDIDNEAPPKEQTFLSVHVLSKRAYSLKGYVSCRFKRYDDPDRLFGWDYIMDRWLKVFVSPPIKKEGKNIPRKREELPC